ncbi:putative endoplasmic reticulum membrane protein [Lachnellula suecica]|uniref:Putative endoplasmic reticulum membrane protein n=1 Tax=Lachnellula suecica TaxID=602035 RepID=A0A8T9C1W0_9HELO|nr:putative endoplasmic reticulum membrane protein [Lachnellula suecica]
MRLSASLLPAVLGIVSAASESASVYLLGADELPSSNPPTLNPQQARLVFAQRLGVSQYHAISPENAEDSTLSYINQFGGQRESLFEDLAKDQASELVLVVDGVSSSSAEPLLKAWKQIKPAFSISNPPATSTNKKLVLDLNIQSGQQQKCALEDAVNPYEAKCWSGKSKVIHFDLGGKDGSKIEELMEAQKRLIQWAKKEEMNTMVVLIPDSARSSKSFKTYGSYEMPSQARLGARQAEEIMSETPPASSSPAMSKSKQVKTSNSTGNTGGPVLGVPALCHQSMEACNNATNGCSGHGECYKKFGTPGKSACFTCGCVAQNETFAYGNNGEKRGFRLVEYGGAACQKRDVSSAFWLIATSSVVMMGLVGWAIGMLFSIGEEKLPGVIGAGVSSNRAK